MCHATDRTRHPFLVEWIPTTANPVLVLRFGIFRGFDSIRLKHNLDSKGWNSQVRGECLGYVESTHLSREHVCYVLVLCVLYICMFVIVGMILVGDWAWAYYVSRACAQRRDLRTIYTYIYIYVYIYIYIYMYVGMYIYIYIHTYNVYMYICIYIYIYTHIYITLISRLWQSACLNNQAVLRL